MWLFTPKWKSKDVYKREEWVLNNARNTPKHNEILISLVKKKENKRLAIAAIKKITNQEALAEFSRNQKESDAFREAAVERLTDQNVLCDVALNDSSQFVSKAAVLRITDQAMLKLIEKKQRGTIVGEAARKRIKPEKKDIKICYSCGSNKAIECSECGKNVCYACFVSIGFTEYRDTILGCPNCRSKITTEKYDPYDGGA